MSRHCQERFFKGLLLAAASVNYQLLDDIPQRFHHADSQRSLATLAFRQTPSILDTGELQAATQAKHFLL